VAERKVDNKVFDKLFDTAHDFIAYPAKPKPGEKEKVRGKEAA